MANLAMAVPSMQSGDPQGSSGDAIVTEKSFVNFANSFDKLSPKLTSNRKKTQRVRERIDLMMERRMRRMGEPQKVKDEVEDDDEASGGAISSISSALGGIIKGMLVFLKTVGKWLMKNLLGFGPIGIAAKAAIAALFTKAGLIAGAAILGTIGVGFLAKEVIDIFKGSEKGASPAEDDLGLTSEDFEGGDDEAPDEFGDLTDYGGDGDDTVALEEYGADDDFETAAAVESGDLTDYGGDGDDTQRADAQGMFEAGSPDQTVTIQTDAANPLRKGFTDPTKPGMMERYYDQPIGVFKQAQKGIETAEEYDPNKINPETGERGAFKPKKFTNMPVIKKNPNDASRTPNAFNNDQKIPDFKKDYMFEADPKIPSDKKKLVPSPRVKAPAPAGKPKRAPTQVASMKVGEPVKATVKASGGSGGESSSDLKKKVEDLYRIENVNRRAYQEARKEQNKIDVRDTSNNKKYPQGYQIDDPNGEDYNSEAAAADKKTLQAHEKWTKSRDKWEAAKKRLKALKKKEDDDFEKGFDDKEFEMAGGGSTKTASSGSSTTTVKKQEKVVKTKTETVTGGGSTLRKSAETVKSPEAKKLEAEAAVLKKQRNELKKRLKAKGMKFSQWSRDPQIRALTKKIKDLQIKAESMPGIVVKRGSTTRTPGKNIRKSSKKVIIKPVIIAKETRVRA